MTRHTTDKLGRRIDLVPVLAKLDAYFRKPRRYTASIAEVVQTVRERDLMVPIPRCGALLREALGQGLITRDEIFYRAPVERDDV